MSTPQDVDIIVYSSKIPFIIKIENVSDVLLFSKLGSLIILKTYELLYQSLMYFVFLYCLDILFICLIDSITPVTNTKRVINYLFVFVLVVVNLVMCKKGFVWSCYLSRFCIYFRLQSTTIRHSIFFFMSDHSS